MRFVTTITVLALGAGISFGPSIPFDELRSIESVDDALEWVRGRPDDSTVALEARCGSLPDESRRHHCEEALAARFASGRMTPQSVIRLHCTRVESVWDAPLPEPPHLCAERFGGWVTG